MIEASSITFGYRRDRPVLSDWSARIGAGESVAIVGPSGSGKSSLLYVLGTLVRPWSGQLHIGGRAVDHLSDAARSQLRAVTIGFVFQDAMLDPRRTVFENVTEGSVYRGEGRRTVTPRALELLRQLRVEVEPSRRATDLSGGQAQRVALCRALLNNPRIILADEPTGNLDRTNADEVEEILFAQARAGAALVIVTHDVSLASRCSRQYEL